MKSSLRKLRGFALQRQEQRVDRDRGRGHATAAATAADELLAAAQDMADMRSCYDNLLSVAAAIANSAYEFSEALQEMGTCLLKRVTPNKDGINDSYRVHVLNTITTPSLSLLNELQTVEEMKHQCDEKKELYEFMVNTQKEKGRSKNAKGDNGASEQLKQAQEDYQEEATLFLFRLKSLKQGQFRSLFTQAARHHAAQLNLFRKGVKSLEAVEPHVRLAAEQQHIDHQFSALEEEDYLVEDENDDDYNGSHDGELSFDYGENKEVEESGNASRNHTEGFFNRSKEEYSSVPHERQRIVSQSAPLFPEKKLNTEERIKDLRRSATRKLNTYVLPTPNDVGATSQRASGNPTSEPLESKGAFHSSPLHSSADIRDLGDSNLPSPTRLSNVQSVLKDSNTNKTETRKVLPVGDLALPSYHDLKTSDNKKVKRGSFSGPIASRPRSTENIDVISAAPRHSSAHQPVHMRVSPGNSPPPISSPKIKELHELPRPPVNTSKNIAFPSLVAHSAPLAPNPASLTPKVQDHFRTKQTLQRTASPLPTPPPGSIARSFSIPSRGISDSKETEDQHKGAARMSLSSLPSAQTFLEDRQPLSSAAGSVSKT
ncbi:hydroxyproline-rich glycoprotein family protein [Zea mays]|uniref:Hydroxyproline-rich glycoprotein family protein n=1 Tax=Zea mays TaxID=4577 RepID=A0A1D6ESX1_MAIZE|nr:hydroxyproline-rich glycoprotein family protein [Zea mays]ONM22815.1 hydroxyproline-rich glycoprotein family protein [Zea mays]